MPAINPWCNGCLGAETTGKMYIDSGGGTAGNLREADLYVFPIDGYSPVNPPNTFVPLWSSAARRKGLTPHGATLTTLGKYQWIAHCGRNFLWVVDTETDQVVNTIGGGLR